MLNSVNLVGRLTRRADFSITQSNHEVAVFTLAVEDSYKSKNGEKKVNFIRCVCFNAIAKNVNQYLDKGSLISVSGKIQARSYDRGGERQYITEVVAEKIDFIDTKKPEGNTNTSPTSYQNAYSGKEREPNPFANGGPVDIDDEDLPF